MYPDVAKRTDGCCHAASVAVMVLAMAKTHFEILVERQIQNCRVAALSVSGATLDEMAIKLAKFQGKADGLRESLDLHRQAMNRRADPEGEPDLGEAA